MGLTLSWYELGFFLLLYSFLGWLAEAAYFALVKRRFYNRGILTLPLLLSHGSAFVLLILVLPTLGNRRVLQFLTTAVIISVVEALSDHLFQRVSPKLRGGFEREQLFSGSKRGLISTLLITGTYYLFYLIVHPLLLGLTLLLPPFVLKAVVLVLLAVLRVDFVTVVYALWSGGPDYIRLQQGSRQRALAVRLTSVIWKRLHKAYPGLRELEAGPQPACPFARGLCLDKLVWVFLLSALLGDIIETFYCGLVDGAWMSRSSVLYGPFSFVWGLGAVVLTVTLQRLAEKNDRYVFVAGFFIGGAYEYMCSVFTELVFGTVFWDYSDMPLNIGGRTNVLFCFFWGILAVVWIKQIYPPMSKAIEALPALAGKALTWVVVFVMLCNGVLTCAAMLRYSLRPLRPESANLFEQFLDSQYDDAFMEHRWPNMIVTEPPAAPGT